MSFDPCLHKHFLGKKYFTFLLLCLFFSAEQEKAMHLLDISAVDDSMMIEGCNEVQLHFKLILISGVGGEIYKI